MGEDSDVLIPYRLPVTTVTIDGTRTIVSNPYTRPTMSTSYHSKIAVQIEADPQTHFVLRLPHPSKSEAKCNIALGPDGRLVSTDATIDDQSQEQFRALLKAGTMLAGTAIPIAATAFLAPAALPVVVASMVGLGSATRPFNVHKLRADSDPHGEAGASLLIADRAEWQSMVWREPTWQDMGIEEDYAKAKPVAAINLAHLRWSDIQLQAALSGATSGEVAEPHGLVRRLKDLKRARKAIRADLAAAEDAYAKWLALQGEMHTVPLHFAFSVNELPSTSALQDAVGEGHAPSRRDQRWWDVVTELRCAVSVDLEGEMIDETAASVAVLPLDDADRVNYRIPRFATVTHWSVTPDEPGKHEQNNGDPDQPWQLQELFRERHKIVLVPGSHSSLPLRPMKDRGRGRGKPDGDSEVSITFDSDGILSTVKSNRTDESLERSKTLAELPGDIKDAVAASKAVLKPMSIEGETERLKAQTELLKAQKGLKKEQTPAPDDPLQGLRDEVAKAELEARKAKAEAIVSEPTRSLISITVTAVPEGTN